MALESIMPKAQTHTELFDKLDVYYDGLCPFCTDITKKSSLLRLANNVEMHDLRIEKPSKLENIYDFNKGMLIIADGEHFFGCHAIYLMSIAGYKSFFWSSFGWLLRLRVFACFAYPFFRAFRRITLIILGRSKRL